MGTVSHILLTFLLNAAWQMPLVAATAGLSVLSLRRLSPERRYALWSAAMVAAVLLPLLSLNVSLDSNRRILLPDGVTEDEVAAPAGLLASRAVPIAPLAGVMIAALYSVLVAAGALRFGWACYGVRKIRRAARDRDLPDAIREADERCRARLGLMPIPILCSSNVAAPLTIGYQNPIIVLPEPLFEERSAELLRSVIGHEMAHIARGDYLRKLILEMVYLPVCFHPAAWLLKKRIDQSRELACDELVTREIVPPGDYAQSMLDVARSVAQLPKPACSLGVLDGDILERRIRTVLNPGARFGRWIGLAALAFATLALAALTVKASGFGFGLATAGSLSGRVFDISGGIVPNTTVVLTEHQTGARYLQTTSAAGEYSFESLPVGRYTLKVEKRGFQRFLLKNVNPGRTARVNPVLRLGKVKETITVSSKLN